MENLFSSKMVSKTNSELERMVENRGQFQSEAVLAAMWELRTRDLIKPEQLELLSGLEDSFSKEEKANEIKQRRQEYKSSQRFEKAIGILTFKDRSKVVPSIIYLCLFLYCMMLISGVDPVNPDVNDLVLWGGNIDQLSFGNQPWRLMAHMFLHLDIFHLLMNLIVLYFIGPLTEYLIGRKPLIWSFLLTGIFGGIVSGIWNTNIVSVGASGAIFGLFGIALTILLLSDQKGLKNVFMPNISAFIGYNIFIGFLQDGVDNAAHIGGLVGGLLLGVIFHFTILKKVSLKERLFAR